MKKVSLLLLLFLFVLCGCSSNKNVIEGLKQLDTSYNINITYTTSNSENHEMLCSINDDELICYTGTNASEDNINLEANIANVLSLEEETRYLSDIIIYVLYYLFIDYSDLDFNKEEGYYELETEAMVDLFVNNEISDLSRAEILSEIEEEEMHYYFIFEDGQLVESILSIDGREEQYVSIYDYSS